MKKVALITGGSRGIGRGIAEALSAKEFFVVINYSSSSVEAEEFVARDPENRFAVRFDVSDPLEIQKGFDELEKKSMSPDVLVNNAGITKDNLLVRLSYEDILKVLNTNLLGAILCSKLALKSMLKRRWGRIVNISSVVGQMGNAGQCAYVASKAGLIGFTKALAKEVASRGITVNCLAPGYIETAMTAGLDPAVQEQMLKLIPIGRFGTVEDVANCCAFLCSEEAAYITGATINVNGGLYM
jgi:3-oxoacyl-[acyl-carrier protein] reductase